MAVGAAEVKPVAPGLEATVTARRRGRPGVEEAHVVMREGEGLAGTAAEEAAEATGEVRVERVAVERARISASRRQEHMGQ